MPHSTHNTDAYRDNGFEWIVYCKNCSAENNVDLEKECPGRYVRKGTKIKFVDKGENEITSAIGGGYVYSEKEDQMIDISKEKVDKEPKAD